MDLVEELAIARRQAGSEVKVTLAHSQISALAFNLASLSKGPAGRMDAATGATMETSQSCQRDPAGN